MIRYIGGPLHNKIREEPCKHSRITTVARAYGFNKHVGFFMAHAVVVYVRRTPNVYVMSKTETDMRQLKFVRQVKAAEERRQRKFKN